MAIVEAAGMLAACAAGACAAPAAEAADPRDAARAVAAVQREISSLSGAAIRERYVRDPAHAALIVTWVTAHQVLAAGPDEAKLRRLLAPVAFDARSRPFLPPGIESHPGQIGAILYDVGVPLDRPLPHARGRLTLRALLEAALDAERTPLPARTDPSWWILASLALEAQPGAAQLGRIEAGLRAFDGPADGLADGPPGGAVAGGLVEEGVHFVDALSRFVARYEPLLAEAAPERMPAQRARLLRVRGAVVERLAPALEARLQSAARALPVAAEAFARHRDAPHAIALWREVGALGHGLETLLHPRGILRRTRAAAAGARIDAAADVLAHFARSWLDPSNAPLRARLHALADPDGLPIALSLEAGALQHAARGLGFWIRWRADAGGAAGLSGASGASAGSGGSALP